MTTYRQALRDLPSNYTTSDSGDLKPDLRILIGRQNHNENLYKYWVRKK